MGITRWNLHKKTKTGARKTVYRKKRKHELGRPAANTKLGPKKVHILRVRGGNKKFRALRLDHGNFAWGSEGITRKSRIVDVMYNACGHDLVRTKTLVKNAIILIDASPFRNWYEAHYALSVARKKETKLTAEQEAALNKKKSRAVEKKFTARQKFAKLEQPIQDQLSGGRILACISSRPGQVGRCDGYILEGKELEFYLRKIKHRKNKA